MGDPGPPRLASVLAQSRGPWRWLCGGLEGMLWSGWQETTSSRVLRGCEPASGTQFLEPPTIVTFFKRVRIERAARLGSPGCPGKCRCKDSYFLEWVERKVSTLVSLYSTRALLHKWKEAPLLILLFIHSFIQ